MKHIETYMDVGGIPLRLVRGGKGARVLFLHGAAGLQGWLPFFDALSTSHEVVATEHPGFGLSHAQAWGDTIGKLADFYVSLLRKSELGKVHLIGSSLGGWLASEIAIRDQSLLRSLVLLAPAGMNSAEIPVPDLLGWSYQELMTQVFADQKIAEQVLSQPLSALQQELRSNNRLAVERLARNGLDNPDLFRSLSSVKIATTIVWGDADRVTPTGYAPLWKHAIPHAHLHIVPNCGHLPHIEQLSTVMGLLKPHLS
jgi:pimeloyl-ACP methyl ester carboxylesterase